MIFTDEQEKVIQEAVNWFHYESKQIFEISGGAGTGKTVTIMEIVKRLGLREYEYLPVAYTGAAAIVMRMRGFPNAKSIHSTFYHLEKIKRPMDPNAPDPYNVNTTFNLVMEDYEFVPIPVGGIPKSRIKLIIIDEGFMVPEFMRHTILKHGIKVLVCGDAQQLPPIGGGPAFLTGDGIHWLTQIMRQNANNPIIYLASRAIQGEPIHCGYYGPNAMVIEDKDLTNDMVLHVGNIICGTNKTRDMFNFRIRELLGKKDNIPEFGDRVICRNNNWDIENDGISLANGLQGYITSTIDASCFDRRNKDIIRMDFLPDCLGVPFYDLKVNYPYLVSNYDNRNRIKSMKYTRGELFEFSYAITTHLSQGSEYPAGIYFEEFLRPEIQNSLIYTGITRFKQYMIYVKPSKKYW